MTNKLKSPESGVSRRDLLQAGGILMAGVALAGCAGGTGAGGNETPRSTSETQRSNESEKAAEKLKVDKEAFRNWEDMTPEQQQRVFDDWFELNGITKPMPEYATGEGTHKYAEAVARWFVEKRCRPLNRAYRDLDLREYADAMARDVLTIGGKNPKGTDNRLYETICDDDVDRFDPETPFAYSPYTLVGTTDIEYNEKININIPGHDPNKAVSCCIAMFESGSPETDLLYLWVQLAFGTDASNPNKIRAIVAGYSSEPWLKKHPEIKFYEVNKQTA